MINSWGEFFSTGWAVLTSGYCASFVAILFLLCLFVRMLVSDRHYEMQDRLERLGASAFVGALAFTALWALNRWLF